LSTPRKARTLRRSQAPITTTTREKAVSPRKIVVRLPSVGGGSVSCCVLVRRRLPERFGIDHVVEPRLPIIRLS
jgi:hypothetical protein